MSPFSVLGSKLAFFQSYVSVEIIKLGKATRKKRKYSFFLFAAVAGDKNPEKYEVSCLSEDVLRMLEADSFWCMQKLLEGIQDNYTLAQPGIQTKIMALKDLIKRLDSE